MSQKRPSRTLLGGYTASLRPEPSEPFFPETERGTGAVGTLFQELQPELEPSLSVKPILKHKKKTSSKGTVGTRKPDRTARSVPMHEPKPSRVTIYFVIFCDIICSYMRSVFVIVTQLLASSYTVTGISGPKKNFAPPPPTDIPPAPFPLPRLLLGNPLKTGTPRPPPRTPPPFSRPRTEKN